MFRNNKELRRSLILMAVVAVFLTAAGFAVSASCGIFALAACLLIAAIHVGIESYRCRRLQKLSHDLDELLISGKPLPIREYDEGELSILAGCQRCAQLMGNIRQGIGKIAFVRLDRFGGFRQPQSQILNESHHNYAQGAGSDN